MVDLACKLRRLQDLIWQHPSNRGVTGALAANNQTPRSPYWPAAHTGFHNPEALIAMPQSLRILPRRLACVTHGSSQIGASA
jgi:hypothetical protein